MFCTNCGNKLPDNAKFCPNCGAPVHANQPADAAEPAAEAISSVPAFAEADAGNAAETVQAAAGMAAEAVEELKESAEETAEEAVSEAVDVAETAAEGLQEAAESVIEETPEAADAAEEFAEASEDEVSEIVEEIAEEVTESAAEDMEYAVSEVQEPVAETVGEAQDAAEALMEEAQEAADAAAEAVAEAEETTEEAVAEIAETAEDTVTDAVQAAEETADTAEELAESAGEAAGEASEEIREAAEDAAEEVQENAEDAVSVITETVEETVEEAVQAAEEAAGSVSEAVEDTAEEAAQAAEEIAEAVSDAAEELAGNAEETAAEAQEIAEAVMPAIEEAREMPVTETVPQTVPDSVPESVSPETFTALHAPYAQPQDSAPFNPYVQSQTAPQAPQAPAGAVDAAQTAAKSGGKKKGRGILAALLALVVLAGAFLVYWNLPDTKFGRYIKQASQAKDSADYVTATDLYRKALEIHPDDERAIDALSDMYNNVQYLGIAALDEGRYEEAVADVHLMEMILPEESDNNEYAMYDIFLTWIDDEQAKGNYDVLDSLVSRAEQELTPSYVEEIRSFVSGIKEKQAIEDLLEASATAIRMYNDSKDFKGVFEELLDVVDVMKRYEELDGYLPFAVMDTADSGVMFYYSAERDAAQVYIGGLNGSTESGYAETYYVSELSTSEKDYEFFECDNWYNGRPGGEFREIAFKGEPDTPTSDNSATVTGHLTEGKYDGDIVNNRNGKAYNMKFVYGTIQVLDTVDPNGEKGNVVGYTDDKNSWITFKDSALTGSYGVRYLT